jgi:hypothetical protein
MTNVNFGLNVLSFNELRELYYKESRKKLFRVPNYFYSKIIAELPFYLIIQYFFFIFIILASGLNSNPANIARLFFTATMTSIMGQAAGLFISAAANDMSSAA